MITVFTPTYNRASTLPRLFNSLLVQSCYDFEWLVINDGSTDGTSVLFEKWLREEYPFAIRYYEKENGGKQRAINEAVTLAKGEYFIIVDSDDALAEDAIKFINKGFASLPPKDSSYIGISGLRVHFDGSYIRQKPLIDSSSGFIDCNNIERPIYNLQADMAEVFYTDKLRQYHFPVWEGESFTPEAVVWDQMALDGYRLRWFDKPIYYCDYQPDGLTNSSWKLLKDNPMGYAMLFNTRLQYLTNNRLNCVIQFIACCCLAGDYSYVRKCYSRLAILVFPLGFLLSIRRRQQIKKYS